MKINVIKPKSLFFSPDFNICVNNVNHNVVSNISIEIPESACDFNINMFYLKTKNYTLTSGNEYTIEVGRIINRNMHFLLIFMASGLFVLDQFYDTKLTNNLLELFCYVVSGFIILINTIGYRYFFTVKIIKNK